MSYIEEIFEVFLTMASGDEVDLYIEHSSGTYPAKLVKQRSCGYIVSEHEGCPVRFSGASANKYNSATGYNSWGLGANKKSFTETIGTLEAGKSIIIKPPLKRKEKVAKIYKNYKITRK